MLGGLDVGLFITLLSTIFAVYVLARNQERIRGFFARVLSTEDAYRRNRAKVDLDIKVAQAGMAEYERQVILDILKDQLAHSREDFTGLQEDVEAVEKRIGNFETMIINKMATLENKIDRNTNRLDNFLSLLSWIKDNLHR